eukprot:1711889-Pleurochrysis_carterae.AAC.1
MKRLTRQTSVVERITQRCKREPLETEIETHSPVRPPLSVVTLRAPHSRCVVCAFGRGEAPPNLQREDTVVGRNHCFVNCARGEAQRVADALRISVQS